MKYLKKFNETKEHYVVVIEWEHGDANSKNLDRIPFNTTDEMDEFLNFIYDVRKWVPNNGWGNAGYFEDGHYQRERKWIDSIDKKYGNKFSNLIPVDKRFGSGDYSPAVNSIWVEIDGVVNNIVWNKALKQNIINLPKIGDTIKTKTGYISYYGPTLWGEKNDYYDYNDVKHWDDDMPKGEYTEIECVVTDCKIHIYEPYRQYDVRMNRDNDGNEVEEIYNEYLTHYDFPFFEYVLLCRFSEDGYITISDYDDKKAIGFDPNYSIKYHYPKYGTNDYYLVG